MLSAFDKLRKASCIALLAGIVAIGLLGRQTTVSSHLYSFLSGSKCTGQPENELPASKTAEDADFIHTGSYANIALKKCVKNTGCIRSVFFNELSIPFFKSGFSADHLPIPKPGYYRFLFRYALF